MPEADIWFLARNQSRKMRHFAKKALGKSVQRLYYALTPQRADDPW
ncbi:hypothetical protein [Mycoplana sp. MJR14]|nr:hypothetical protein [Mycoplana sp. MJR14]MDF1635462.1 hypothetical protein [Mycoplana sp. MJR14]